MAQFATSVVTANLSTTKVVKLLGARKDTKSTLGGRTVMSGSKVGSMTGTRHRRAAHSHGSPRRLHARTHTPRAHTAAEGATQRAGAKRRLGRSIDETRIRQAHPDAGDETLPTLTPSFALALFKRRVLAE